MIGSDRMTARHLVVMIAMGVVFVGHVLFLSGSEPFVLGLPWWYWGVAGVALTLYVGTVLLIMDLAVGEEGAPLASAETSTDTTSVNSGTDTGQVK
jgi:hypothetical protein